MFIQSFKVQGLLPPTVIQLVLCLPHFYLKTFKMSFVKLRTFLFQCWYCAQLEIDYIG